MEGQQHPMVVQSSSRKFVGMAPSKAAAAGEPSYDPPRVEAVITAADLNRETLYAGAVGYATI